MLYAIISQDNAQSLAKRLEARLPHVQRLQQLQYDGKLILAGPFPAIDSCEPGPAGFTGSLIIAEFADLAHAQTWANTDPYIIAGVYNSVEVRPFKKTFPT